MQNKLQEMFDLQDNMNSTVDSNWITQRWNFLRAARMECSELIDMIGWKWWKKQSDLDLVQIQLELVDIWHFGLSHLLVKNNKSGEPLSIFRLSSQYADAFKHYPQENVATGVDLVETIIKDSFRDLFNPQLFMNVCAEFDLDFDKLYEMYVAKNALNIFRQENGYKTGGYSRKWPKFKPSIDDNKILETIIEVAKQSDVDDKGGMFQYLMWQMDLCYNHKDVSDMTQEEIQVCMDEKEAEENAE